MNILTKFFDSPLIAKLSVITALAMTIFYGRVWEMAQVGIFSLP